MSDESATLDPILRAVDLLAPAFEASGLDELEVESGEIRVRLARPRAVAVASAAPATGPAVPSAAVPAEKLSPYGEPAPGVGRQVQGTAVGHEDAARHPRRARGVEDVGQAIEAHRGWR